MRSRNRHVITLSITGEQFDAVSRRAGEYGVGNTAFARACVLRELWGTSVERQLVKPPPTRNISVSLTPELRALALGSRKIVIAALEGALDASDLRPIAGDGERDTERWACRLPIDLYDCLSSRCRALGCTRGAYVRAVLESLR